MVITISPELEAALNELAQQQKVSPEDLALDALRERFLAPSMTDDSRDEWERRLRQAATDCGVSLPDTVLSSEGLYE